MPYSHPSGPISGYRLARGTIDEYTQMGYYGDMAATGADMTQNQFDSSNRDGNPDIESFPAPRTSTSYAHDKAKIMARLRRMEGQVRGVQRMVEEDQYCLDVLTQLSAIIAAARQTGLLVLEDHVRGCVLGTEHAQDDEIDREELLTELIGAIDRFGRSVG
jgi:CsoR family transcriptional regulator, copper-sensing transcriptional repressor